MRDAARGRLAATRSVPPASPPRSVPPPPPAQADPAPAKAKIAPVTAHAAAPVAARSAPLATSTSPVPRNLVIPPAVPTDRGIQPQPRVSDRTREMQRLGELRAELERKLQDTADRLQAKEKEISTLAAQQDTLRSLASVRADRIRELESELAGRDRTIAELRAELSKMAAGGPPPEDDLKRIRGIGPKFEAKLHAVGIRRFAEIAAWTDGDVELFAERLKIHAQRIRNAGWVESAKELVASGSPDAAP